MAKHQNEPPDNLANDVKSILSVIFQVEFAWKINVKKQTDNQNTKKMNCLTQIFKKKA